VEATFPYAGSLSKTIQQLAGGMRSGFSYCGAHTIEELRSKAQFIQITGAAVAESRPHALQRSAQVHPDYRKLFVE
jgi:IMP dehydrogenase/GMP reductase